MTIAQKLISATDVYRSAYPSGTRPSGRSSEWPLLIHIAFLLTVHRLSHGNFVLDFSVPTKLLNMCALRNEREFTHMRYSAATCDPNDFMASKFNLCPLLYDPPHKTEL